MKRHCIALAFSALAVAASAQPALDGSAANAALERNGCSSCHEVDKRVVGPAFRDVARRYAGDKGASLRLQDKIKRGGTHVWGDMVMPPNVLATDDEIKLLVDWILALQP